MQRFRIRHETIYRYATPVALGEHRLMLRPRGSHDLKMLDSRLTISPPPAALRWLYDVFGNSVAVARFDAPAAELRFLSELHLEHYPLETPDVPIEEYARTFPFSYAAEEAPDLGRTLERHYPDPERTVDSWAKGFVVPAPAPPAPATNGGLVDTQALLERMTAAIKEGFTYAAREAEGTQPPAETLALKSGSCRDFALLMMEAVRSLGLAARFVSGYLYDPAADDDAEGTAPDGTPPDGSMVGAGATHAWVQVYLPGAGWVEFDPTNGIVGSRHLIRVAVTRDPAQAAPIAGTWFGAPADFLGMSVAVRVTTEHAPAPG